MRIQCWYAAEGPDNGPLGEEGPVLRAFSESLSTWGITGIFARMSGTGRNKRLAGSYQSE